MNSVEKLALSLRPSERRALLREATSEFLRQAKAQAAEDPTGGKIARQERKKISHYQHMRWLANNEAPPTRPRASPEIEDRSVYVIGCTGQPIKIGIARDPYKRLADLQVGFPHKLQLYWSVVIAGTAAVTVERAAHKRLAAKRLNGEWFDVDPDDAIEAIKVAAEPFLESGQ